MIKAKKIFLIAACLLAQSFLALQASASTTPPKFFSSLQDVPLMPGLVELKDQGVAFDKPEGRIIEAVAEIENVSSEAIKKSYSETLPQLGWIRTGDQNFVREKELLTLKFESYSGRNFVRILVQPVEGVSN